MSSVKVIKRGDTGNIISMSFAYDNGVDDIDIPDSTPCVLTMVNKMTGVVVIDRRTVTINDVTSGVVTVNYQWDNTGAETDTLVAGLYRAELEFDVSGDPVTMPTIAYINVLIDRDLG